MTTLVITTEEEITEGLRDLTQALARAAYERGEPFSSAEIRGPGGVVVNLPVQPPIVPAIATFAAKIPVFETEPGARYDLVADRGGERVVLHENVQPDNDYPVFVADQNANLRIAGTNACGTRDGN